MVECGCEDIKKIVKEIVNEIFNERLVKLTTEMKTKHKRKPSQYNIFIGECMKKGENMKNCATKYKQQKGKKKETFEHQLSDVKTLLEKER